MRALMIRGLQGLCLAGAMVVLTGANGEGCSPPGDPGDPVDPPVEPPNPCEPGTHLELICEPHPCDDYPVVHHGEEGGDQEPGHPGEPIDENCFEACVPDDVCPEGTQEQLICIEPMPYPDEPVCIQENGEPCDDVPPPPPPPEEECFVECVPIDDCGPGFYQEWICEGYVEGDPGDPDGDAPLSMPCYDDDDGNCEPPPPEECYPICLPVDECGPGFHEEFICEEPPQPPPEPCDPDGNCEEPQNGGGEDPGDIGPDDPTDPFCEAICVPDDPACPPGSEPVMICEEWEDFVECWEECLPTGDCPPPLVLEVVCEESPDGQSGECFETCVDPTDPVDPGDPGEPDPAN